MTHFRNATLPELALILDWAAEEGWNPGLDDADAFFSADPDGFFVAVDETDALIASISVVNHTPDFSFLGLYIVKPDHRGHGVGLGLWTHALSHAGDRTVGLDGVPDQQANYRVSGFQNAGETTRFEGQVRGETHVCISAAVPGDIPALVRIEGAASRVEKPDYLQAWFLGSATRSTLVFRDQGRIRGFCTLRHCQMGWKVGPLVAEDSDVARHLIAHAAALSDGPLTLDVPETAIHLTELCQRLGLDAGFKTARMYRGPFSASQHGIFAVSSLELG